MSRQHRNLDEEIRKIVESLPIPASTEALLPRDRDRLQRFADERAITADAALQLIYQGRRAAIAEARELDRIVERARAARHR